MIEIFKKFFAFSGPENARKFHRSIWLGLLEGVGEAMKIPAIMLVLLAVLNGNVTAGLLRGSVLLMLASLALTIFCRLRSTMLQTEGGYDAAAFKRIEIARHLRYLPMGYFNAHSLGEITSVTTNTMDNLSNVATRVILLTTRGLINTAVMLAFVTVFDWRVGVIGFIGFALFLFVNHLLQNAGQRISEDKVASDTKVVSEIMEYVQGIAEVKNYSLTGIRAKKMNRTIEENAKINTRMEFRFLPYTMLQNWVMWLTGGAMMLLSLHLFLSGSMSLAYCIGMCICAFLLFGSLESAGSYSSLLHMVDICVDKANAILALPTMDIEGEEITPEHTNMETENITFSYGEKKIIDGITMRIPEKTSAALVGPSGSGKTTLTSLLSRFWDVDSGTVTLGGRNVKEYSYDSLMKNFSFVFQNVYLFHDTIANNIRFGTPDASMEQVMEAAKMACCHDFIMALPEGYDTVIGEGGSTLSGGERQRISIARAIMKDAPIIILDEATANVDPENERELMEAVRALTEDKTIVMIAHRLKTVRGADQIFVIDQGRIAQQGTHEQLKEQEGIYRRFLESREKSVSWRL